MNRVNTAIPAIVLTIALASPVGTVLAEPSSEVAFDLETIHLLRNADVDAGKAVADKHKCRKCHGDAGISEDPEEVNLAGMSRSYLYKQMMDFHGGQRDSREMKKALRKLNSEDMANISAWYASLEGAKRAETEPDENTLKLVYHGDPTRMLKSCRSCHGRKGQGGQFQHPGIAGQNRDYFIETMTAFKEGDRENDVYSRMRNMAAELTDEEIEALATFYSAYVVPDEDE